MDATQHTLIMQRLSFIQDTLIPELKTYLGPLTPKLERLIHLLEWVRIEEFVVTHRCGVGRPAHERAWLANAFVAKALLGLSTTKDLIERMSIDRALRRICGFSSYKKLPSEATFSRAFEAFANAKLAERVHEAMVREHLGDALIGHLSRDATAINAHERPARKEVSPTSKARQETAKEGKPSSIARQRQQTLEQMSFLQNYF